MMNAIAAASSRAAFALALLCLASTADRARAFTEVVPLDPTPLAGLTLEISQHDPRARRGYWRAYFSFGEEGWLRVDVETPGVLWDGRGPAVNGWWRTDGENVCLTIPQLYNDQCFIFGGNPSGPGEVPVAGQLGRELKMSYYVFSLTPAKWPHGLFVDGQARIEDVLPPDAVSASRSAGLAMKNAAGAARQSAAALNGAAADYPPDGVYLAQPRPDPLFGVAARTDWRGARVCLSLDLSLEGYTGVAPAARAEAALAALERAGAHPNITKSVRVRAFAPDPGAAVEDPYRPLGRFADPAWFTRVTAEEIRNEAKFETAIAMFMSAHRATVGNRSPAKTLNLFHRERSVLSTDSFVLCDALLLTGWEIAAAEIIASHSQQKYVTRAGLPGILRDEAATPWRLDHRDALYPLLIDRTLDRMVRLRNNPDPANLLSIDIRQALSPDAAAAAARDGARAAAAESAAAADHLAFGQDGIVMLSRAGWRQTGLACLLVPNLIDLRQYDESLALELVMARLNLHAPVKTEIFRTAPSLAKRALTQPYACDMIVADAAVAAEIAARIPPDAGYRPRLHVGEEGEAGLVRSAGLLTDGEALRLRTFSGSAVSRQEGGLSCLRLAELYADSVVRCLSGGLGYCAMLEVVFASCPQAMRR